jgi:LDH2 family malate/lactate/ureidoglycolate dehydrogenase
MEVWDGAKKLGPAISSTAQAHAVEMAKLNGMGAVMVRDCNHFGWGPAYALEHLNEDLVVGNITQGAIPIVTPIGGIEPTVGSNAIAIAIHTGADECPFFLWDTGTAAMSWGEVEKLRAEEELGSRNSRGEAPGTLPVVIHCHLCGELPT